MTQVPDGLELTHFDETFYKDPYAVYKKLRTLAPVLKNAQSFYGQSWTSSDYELTKSLLTDKRLSVDPRVIGIRRDPRADNPVTMRDPDMMNLDGDDHKRLRSLVHKAFTPSSIDTFRETIQRIVDDTLALIAESSFDVVTTFSKPIPTIVIAEYIGVDPNHHKQFKAWTDSLLLQGYPMPTEAQWEEIVSADAELRQYMMEVVAARRTQRRSDLISRLVEAHEEQDLLSDTEVIDMCCLLIGAGNFTTTDLISNCLYLALTQDIDVKETDWSLFVEEALRFDPPAMAVRRFVLEDIEVAGHKIEKGSVINLLTGASNHDPAQFENPDVFEARREDMSHLAFGRGLHHCLGAPLARLEATIALGSFFKRFPNATLATKKRSRRMDFSGFTSLTVTI